MWERLRTLGSRLLSWTRLRRVDEEFAEELQSHAAMLADDNRRLGLSPEEARRQAMVRLGGMAQLREIHRGQRGLPLLERLAQDLRYAARMLRKSPGFTLFAGAALALGIGATTAVFSIADAVLLRPLPYRDPSQLVMLWEDDTAYGFPHNETSPETFLDWRRRNAVFEDIAAVIPDSMSLTGSGNPEQLHSRSVSGNFFAVLGVNAALGRTLVEDDSVPGKPLTAVISHALWVRRFGGDRTLIGQDLLLDGAKYTVVGVMPPGFQFLDRETDLWVPAQWDAAFLQARGGNHYVYVVGRLKPGISPQTAGQQMKLLGEQWKQAGIENRTGVVQPLHEYVSRASRAAILMLLAAVGFVLLIACANIANLLLARGSARSREIAVRLALGAGRRRVIEQMLTESVLLSCLAGVAGVVLAVELTGFLAKLVPQGIAAAEARVDWRVLLFAAAVSVATGVLFGILPSLRASQIKLSNSLKLGGRSAAGAAGQRLRSALVVSEVALAIVLLTGAALMIRSFEKLYHQDPGFRAQQVLTMRTPLPQPKYKEFARRTAFYRDVVQRVEALPGVVAAGYSSYLPLANSGGGMLVSVENRPVDPKHMLIANVRVVTPNNFRAVGMTLRRGRLLDGDDGPDAAKVVVINETMAHQYWPGEDSLGHRFKTGSHTSTSPWFTVVGVVADVRQGGMNVPVRPEAYFSFQQVELFAPEALAVRTSSDPGSIVEEVRKQIWAVDKDQPVSDVMPLDLIVDESVAAERMQASLLGGVAALALMLATLGIYAVLSFAVAQRTQEIGVRLALGAKPTDVLRMVISRGLALFGTGLVIGVAAALGLSRLMAHLLFGVSAGDPLSYASVTVLLAAVTLLACYLPARRAMRVEPMAALRYE